MTRILIIALAVFLLGCSEEKKKTTVSQPQITEAPPEPEKKEAPETAEDADKNGGHPPISRDAPKDVGGVPADATKTKSGLAWKQVRKGTGTVHAGQDDVVWVHYNAWSTDGKLKQSTYRRGQPRVMKMATAVKGWREAIQLMVQGERRRYWMPKNLAFSRSKARSKTAGMRVVEFDLLNVFQAPKAPADLKRPPKDAKKTGTGLVWRELSPGKGTTNPGPESAVTVKYAGWTRDGRCFDFTPDDETQTFTLGRVIEGWTEGIQLMVPGQKARFWIPKKLAYKGQGGKPQGLLVFDVELVEFSAAQ